MRSPVARVPGTFAAKPKPGERLGAFNGPNGLHVIVTVDDGRWHLSISHEERYPTWDEIRDARYEFIPDEAHMVMVLPPKSEYVNVHSNCFQLWEIKERW